MCSITLIPGDHNVSLAAQSEAYKDQVIRGFGLHPDSWCILRSVLYVSSSYGMHIYDRNT